MTQLGQEREERNWGRERRGIGEEGREMKEGEREGEVGRRGAEGRHLCSVGKFAVQGGPASRKDRQQAGAPER